MQNPSLTIYAGPCSVDQHNLAEIYQIADLTVTNQQGQIQKAIAGTRVVGLKSRTALNPTGDGMGIDYQIVIQNFQTLITGGTSQDLQPPPSLQYMLDIIKKTNLNVATEIMMPTIQLPIFEQHLPKGKLLAWNPSVNQLGWPVMQTAEYAKRNHWHIGLKNGKWVGDHLEQADAPNYPKQTPLETTWAGLAAYVGDIPGDTILIQRGVDVPDKGNYRNYPIHHIAARVKQASGAKLYFDPSHSYGPKMKQDIVDATIAAMQMTITDDQYLYDGILVEAGTSQTDTEQHISLIELQAMCDQLATFRNLTPASQASLAS